jgi:hypothetical protein
MEDDSEEVVIEFNVVGRLKQDWNKGYETSSGILMAIDDVKALETAYYKANDIKDKDIDNSGYNEVYIKVKSIDDIKPVQDAIGNGV